MTDTTTPAPVQSKPVVATPVEAIPLEAAIVNKEIALGDIPSEGIETTSQKKVWFFEKGVKNVTSFLAKKTGNPDPESWETINKEEQSEGNFFNKLVSGTRNLLSHAESFTETAVSKTKEISKKVIDLPGKVVGGTANVLQKGMNKGNELKEKIEEKGSEISDKLWEGKDKLREGLNKGVDSALDTTDTLGGGLVDGGKKIIKNPMQGISDITRTVGNTAQEIGENTVQGAKKIGENIVEKGEKVKTTIKDKVNNAGTTVKIDKEGNPISEKVGVIWNIKTGGEKVIEKGKKVGTKVLDNTKEIIKNPIGKFDSLVGNQQGQEVIIDENDPNKQHLDQLINNQTLEKKEQELLRKENELLKRENELLKKGQVLQQNNQKNEK